MCIRDRLSSDLSGHLQLCYQHQVIGRLLCFLLFFFCLALLLRLLRVSGGEPSRLGFCDTLASHSNLIHSHQDGRRLLALFYSNNSPSHNCLVVSNNASLCSELKDTSARTIIKFILTI